MGIEIEYPPAVAETWRQVLGDGKNFRGPRMTFFPEKMSIFTPKISDDHFLVIDQVFQILRFFPVLNVVYDPFFTRKTTISEKNSLIRPFFYSLRTFARIRQHYFSKYWGHQCMGRPHVKFWRDRLPRSPLGLRPC